ncbi:hypothetical protein HU200_054594 [Digitaria exilis]|uniref:F-box domain-containing protein n=1 Tax=Digitaria exilis TaxID=1010633 RepID=A0A835AUN2_9POAL|nr:hypothetical protein HU200_054594 [Digitaria exilis]
MATALADRRLNRRYGQADRISDLPDDLLHRILHCVASTLAAVRTSVLSRRWRHLWADLTELRLDSVLAPVPVIDTVDGALSACCVPAVTRLSVSLDHLPPWGSGISADRVAPWLRFAADRVAGDLCILLPPAATRGAVEVAVEEDLHLPVCERVTEITLWLGGRFRLRMPAAAGAFSALTYVNIRDARMESGELEEFVSRGCPRLEDLAVRLPPFLVESVVCIRSDSLRRLDFHIKNTRRLEVAAPRLDRLSMSHAVKAYITAPELGEVAWEDDAFNPLRHKRSTGVKKFVVYLEYIVNGLCRLFSCPCGSPKSRRIDDINLDSLDEIEINMISDEASSDAQAEFVELLLGCNAPMLRKMVINMSCPCPFIREDV